MGVEAAHENGLFKMPPKPEGWGTGAVNPEAAALAREYAAKGWITDPNRKGNYPEDFLPKFDRAKVLYLHGYGENKMTASLQTGDLQHVLTSAAIDTTIVEGFEKIRTHEDTYPIYPSDPEYAREVLKGGLGDAFFWWRLNVPVCPAKGDPGDQWRNYAHETEEVQLGAVRQLVAHIEKLGGVDGIIGFSMGGEMAYLLLQHLEELSEPARRKLVFIATIGSEHILSKIPTSKPLVLPHKMAFWLAYGEEDKEACADVPKAAAFFEGLGARVVTRKLEKQGHEVPKGKQIMFELCSLFLKALGRPYAGEEED
jgi:hypothetical protein